ncbi:hypothetical protein ACHAXA_007351 [Cyclostephanos tholiformis]|uniref:Peptidase M20 dimerisation domain-containing protein n=1 Tax=Cyclostephanos tholiformis TaxID=382380 RepID=A0ABD3RW45_9STRA
MVPYPHPSSPPTRKSLRRWIACRKTRSISQVHIFHPHKGEGRVQDAIYEHLVKSWARRGGGVVASSSGASNPERKSSNSRFEEDGDNAGESRNGGDTILHVGHVFVVPASHNDGWSAHLFDPVVRDGRRVAAIVYAIVALCDLGFEECTGNGALASLPAALAADDAMGEGTRTAVIILEPFPWIVTAQLGVIWFTASVTGRPCHVLSTSSGSNAIEGAYALSVQRAEGEHAHPAFVGIDHPVKFNLGRILGGNWASSVPSRWEFEVRVGFLPGVNINDVKRDVETTMHGRAEELGLEWDIACKDFHADGASLSPPDVGGEAITIMDSSRELQMRLMTCTTDARFNSSIF